MLTNCPIFTPLLHIKQREGIGVVSKPEDLPVIPMHQQAFGKKGQDEIRSMAEDLLLPAFHLYLINIPELTWART